MTDQASTLQTANGYGYGISQEERHKVLRNTYWLLALSLLPTVLGAWVGVATGITQSLRGGMGLIVFLGARSVLCTPSKRRRTPQRACLFCWASLSSWV